MKTLSVNKQAKLQYWAGIIKECQNTGQKKRDWLRDHEISRDTYYYWYKEVEKACATSYNKKTPSENTTAFVEFPAVVELL